ncbi:integrase, catalytic region, zinc finger, CCHC-type containing protein [Tanacetum coccineum]|uniref:Integrase, catalytic region, zinc finger, CCHC-type containing protein n=1 Tax=Tanacetum coccineum TaxID=301880 RepID=A0ABQ5FVJ1_9ASTR
MERRVESLMRSEVLLYYEGGFTSPKRPYQEEFEGQILKLINDQEDQIKQLEEDMRKTKDIFMCLLDSLIATLKAKIEAQRVHPIKIENITRFPTLTPSVSPKTLKPTMVQRVSIISKIKPTNYRTPHQHLNSNLKMPILHSFEENKLEYEDEDAVEIKMIGIEMDKESLEHNLYKNDITLIICHKFSLTSNPPIKPNDPGSFRMKERIKRLMHGSEKTEQQRHLRLVNEFDNFVVVEGESLSSMYERLTTLVNSMDRNEIRPLPVSINTKFLNSLQPEWSKYVTMTRQNANIKETKFDHLFDTLSQYKPHAIHQEQRKLLMRNQELIQDGRVDIQSKTVGYAKNGNRNAGRPNRNQIATAGNRMVQQIKANDQTIKRVPRTKSNLRKPNVQCYNCNAKGHYARDCPQPKVHDAKYFKEQMLLTMKDEAGGNLNEEENDFMLDNHYGDDSLEELNATVILMARIQPTDDKVDVEPKSDVDALVEVNASQIHLRIKCILKVIIFDDPYVDNNGGTDEHDSNADDQSVAFESLIYNKLETCKEDLEREIRVDKDKIDNLIKEKDKIQDEFFQLKNVSVRIQHETELSKKAFKARENKYLEKIVDLHDKLSSHDRIETLKDTEESRLKMKYKMIQLNYEKLHALYETFVPQTEIPIEQTYLSTPSTSNVPSESSKEISNLPVKKMPNESKLLKLFVKLDKSIGDLQTKNNQTLLKDRSRALIFDDHDVLRQFYKTGVIPMSISLRRCSNKIKQEITEEKNETLMLEKDKLSNDSKDIQATMEQRIKILENDFKRVKAQYINLDLKMQHEKEQTACDVSWKSKMTTLSDENTYAYADVLAKNQDLLMTISELKFKLSEQAKNVNTKFDKSATLEKLVCITPLKKNKDLKAKIVSKVEIKIDKSKPVTSCSTSKNEHNQKPNANEIARGMYRVTKIETKTLVAKTNKFSCNSTGVASSSSVSRLDSKDTNSKKRVLLNTKSKSTSKDVKKMQSSFTLVFNKNDTMNLNERISKKRTKKQSQNDKTGHGMEKRGEDTDGSKEAQLLSMAGIKTLKSLTEEKHLARAEDLACRTHNVEAAIFSPHSSPYYVTGPEEPEQPPDYVLESDPEADPEEDNNEDPEEDPVDYSADGGDDRDDEDEPSDEDEDDDVDIEADEE